jgi:DNA-binding transcriptional LysR family regulator
MVVGAVAIGYASRCGNSLLFMNVNLKLLQTFMLVAEHGSFRQAAEDSNRTPSAVSMQVRQLEEQLGVPLFIRTTRKVELTLEGRHLLAKARSAIVDLSLGLNEIRDSALLRRGLVTLASSPTIAASRLPEILVRFEQKYPKVTVRVRELASSELFDSIRQQEVDFGIGPSMPGSTDFHFEPLLQEDLCALIPVDHPLARKWRISIRDLDNVATIMLNVSAAMRRLVEDAARESGTTLNVKYEVHQPQTMVAFAAAGLGVAIVPRIAVPVDQSLPLRVIAISDPPIVRQVSIITAKGRQLSPMAGELAAEVKRSIGSGAGACAV